MYKLFFGIDLGAKAGISVLDENVMHTHESYFGTSKDEAMRYKKFWNHIYAMFDEACYQFEPSEIIVHFEYGARHLVTKAAHAYGAYRMILLMACHTWKIKSDHLSVQAIKKAATKKGNAKKNLMIESAQNRFSPDWELTDNEADSMWIAYLGRELTNESFETIEIGGPIQAVKRDGSLYDNADFK